MLCVPKVGLGIVRRVGAAGAVFAVCAGLGSAQFITDEQARSSGPGHSWQAPLPGVNAYSLAKQTTIPLIGFGIRGGKGIGFALSHSSQARILGANLGGKWRHSFDIIVHSVADGTDHRAAVVWGDHTIQLFQRNGAVWAPRDGYRDQLQISQGSFLLTLKTKERLRFVPTSDAPGIKYKKYVIRTITDRNGNVINFTYDAEFKLQEVSDPSGRLFRFAYDQAKRLASTTLQYGSFSRSWTYGYESLSRLTRVNYPTVTTDFGPVNYNTQFTYTGSNIASVVDRLGNTWAHTYVGDRLQSIQPPLNTAAQKYTFAYSPPTRTFTGPMGDVTTYQYDSLSRLVRAQDASFFDVFFEFNDPNYPWAPNRIIPPIGAAQTFGYDANGNMVQHTDPTGQIWDMSYANGYQLVQALEPLNTDAWGVTQTSRNRTDYVYDATGNLRALRRYTSLLQFIEDSYQYDSFGNRVAHTNGLNRMTQYAYDAHGNLVRLTTPAGRNFQWLFPNAPHIAPDVVVDAVGQQYALLRDEWFRMRTVDFPTTPDHEYRFDGMNRLIREQSASGATTHTLDGNGRLTQTVRGPYTATYSYFADGSVRQFQDTAATGTRTLDYTYDQRRMLASITDGTSNTLFAYDARGRLVRTVYPAGDWKSYEYVGDRLVVIARADFANMLFQRYDLSHQENSALKQVVELNGATTRYGYDALRRLVRENRVGNIPHNTLWAYDAADQRTMQDFSGQPTVYTHDLDGLVQSAASGQARTFQWNANAQMIQSFLGGVPVNRFTWNQAGQLSRIETWNQGTQMFDPQSQHGYDALGNRVRRTSGNEASDYYTPIPADWRVSREEFTDGAVTRSLRSTWGPGGLIQEKESVIGANTNPATDVFGNLRGATDGQGIPTNYSSVFNAFGVTLFETGSRPDFSVGADSGVRNNDDAGLLYGVFGTPGPGGFYGPATNSVLIALLLPAIQSFAFGDGSVRGLTAGGSTAYDTLLQSKTCGTIGAPRFGQFWDPTIAQSLGGVGILIGGVGHDLLYGGCGGGGLAGATNDWPGIVVNGPNSYTGTLPSTQNIGGGGGLFLPAVQQVRMGSGGGAFPLRTGVWQPWTTIVAGLTIDVPD